MRTYNIMFNKNKGKFYCNESIGQTFLIFISVYCITA